MKTMRKHFFILSISIMVGFLATPFLAVPPAKAAPLLANYYLAPLPSDPSKLAELAKMNVLILSPDEFLVRQSEVATLKQDNPAIILLAYVPSQSYNTNYWPQDPIFKHLTLQNNWILRDGQGRAIYPWPTLEGLNMDSSWSEYLVSFINQYIAPLPGVDGVFFDMVGASIPGVSVNNVDLNGDGRADDPNSVNSLWLSRVQYLLSYAHYHLQTQYVVTNGDSNQLLQPYVNGRMYEDFPTPWEANGSWGGLMSTLKKNQPNNLDPNIDIFNATSGNTGNQADYQAMRFGLASSLLLDNVYSSFDYGDQNHGQLWWYDEYNTVLGTATGPAVSLSGKTSFTQGGVWRRDYANGIVLVNAGSQPAGVDLGGNYEKILGTQDPTVNNGAVVDQVTIGAHDGIILLKTFSTITNALFINGDFLRFYTGAGLRARNGFFAFESEEPGGAKIYYGDLNGNGSEEKIVVTGPKMVIYNSRGEIWYVGFPFGANYEGSITMAVGRLNDDPEDELVVAGTSTGEVQIYDYHGDLLEDSIYPLGKAYRGGFSVALRRADSALAPEILLAPLSSRSAEILVYDATLTKVQKRLYPFGSSFRGSLSIAAGDFSGTGSDDIAASANVHQVPTIHIIDSNGRLLKSFTVPSVFGNQTAVLGATIVPGSAEQELVVMTKN